MINFNTTMKVPSFSQSSLKFNDVKCVHKKEKQDDNIVKNKKISFLEGAKLLFNGFKDQAKNMVKSIIQHPVKTIATGVVTTGALMALPLIGIPTAVGGAIFAAGFGLFGAVKFVSNTCKAINNSNNGEYDKARENLKSVGASTMDLALSLPFVPKAVKSLKEFGKYGKIGIDTSTLIKLDSAKGLKAKFDVLNSANKELARSYNYQTVLDKKLDSMALSSSEKAIIKEKVLKLNVSDDEFLDVVLTEYLKAKGTVARPTIQKYQGTVYSRGYYIPDRGVIGVKDYDLPDLPLREATNVGKKIRSMRQMGNDYYKCEIIDMKTGEISYDVVSKKVLDDKNFLDATIEQLSNKGRQVVTIIHEGEHFHQHAEIARAFGIDKSLPSRSLMQQYVSQKGKIMPNTAEFNTANSYRIANNNYTSAEPIPYILNDLELGARNAQLKAIMSNEFQVLESVFNNVTPVKDINYAQIVAPSLLQVQNKVS